MVRIIMIGPTLRQNGGIATLENLLLMYPPSHVEIQHIVSHDEGSVTHRLLIFFSSVIMLLKHLLTNRPDLLHLHLSERASVYRKIIFTWIANQFHIPVLIHANGADFRDFFEGLPTRHQAFVSRSLGRCHYFIAVTKFWRDYYVNHVGLDDKQVLVLPNPAKLPDTVPSRSNALVVKLIFLGRIGHRKGAYDLIRAYHSLSLDIQQKSELIMAGDGDLHEAQQLINELKLMERIRLLGWVNPIKRDQLLQESDVFILPSYNEGLPLAMIEAMGWGLPIITTPIAGIPEVVTPEHNGFLIEPGNIQLLARSIQVLIDNETLRLSMGKAARKTVETFDIKYYSDRIASIYSDMLSKT